MVLNSTLGLVMEDKYELEVYGCLGSSDHKLCSLTLTRSQYKLYQCLLKA